MSRRDRAHIVVRPIRGWRGLDVGGIWRFRSLVGALATRDVKLRYRQTALGSIWVIAQPLLGAGIFSFVFGRVAHLPSNGVPYLLFAYVGILGWNCFSTCLSRITLSLLSNSTLVSKTYFPRLVLPLSVAPAAILDFAVGTVLVPLLALRYHRFLPVQALTLPVWLLLFLVLAYGLGTFLAALAVSYRDVQYIVPVALQILLYASPTAYALTAVPKSARIVYELNPLVGALEAIRWSLLGRQPFPAGVTAYSAVAGCALLVGGLLFFRRSEARFADVI